MVNEFLHVSAWDACMYAFLYAIYGCMMMMYVWVRDGWERNCGQCGGKREGRANGQKYCNALHSWVFGSFATWVGFDPELGGLGFD